MPVRSPARCVSTARRRITSSASARAAWIPIPATIRAATTTRNARLRSSTIVLVAAEERRALRLGQCADECPGVHPPVLPRHHHPHEALLRRRGRLWTILRRFRKMTRASSRPARTRPRRGSAPMTGDGTTTKATNWNETTCAWDTTNGPQKPSSCSAGKIPSLNANVSAKTCSWGWDDESKPCVEGYTHSWSTTRCSYRRSTAKTPKPACQEPQSEATWSCSNEKWEHDPVTADACHANPQNTIGYIYDEWRSTSCAYASRAVGPPSCTGTLEWDISNCEWSCVVIDLTFSFPALISEQTSQATYEQSLDVSFNSDGSITLSEQLVGPNSSSTVSLGSWATGADVAQASSVVEYRLTASSGGQCTGSSSWAAFSGLTVGVFGEAAAGQVTASCSYAFRYADGRRRKHRQHPHSVVHPGGFRSWPAWANELAERSRTLVTISIVLVPQRLRWYTLNCNEVPPRPAQTGLGGVSQTWIGGLTT